MLQLTTFVLVRLVHLKDCVASSVGSRFIIIINVEQFNH